MIVFLQNISPPRAQVVSIYIDTISRAEQISTNTYLRGEFSTPTDRCSHAGFVSAEKTIIEEIFVALTAVCTNLVDTERG